MIVSILSIIAFFILISLFTCDVKNFSENYSKIKTITFFGQMANFTAELLYKWLGIIAYGIPLLLLLLAGIECRDHQMKFFKLKYFLSSFLILILACSFATFLEKESVHSVYMPSYGGIIGIFLTVTMSNFLGDQTSIVLLLFVSIVFFYSFFYFLEYLISKDIKKKKNNGKKKDK